MILLLCVISILARKREMIFRLSEKMLIRLYHLGNQMLLLELILVKWMGKTKFCHEHFLLALYPLPARVLLAYWFPSFQKCFAEVFLHIMQFTFSSCSCTCRGKSTLWSVPVEGYLLQSTQHYLLPFTEEAFSFPQLRKHPRDLSPVRDAAVVLWCRCQ